MKWLRRMGTVDASPADELGEPEGPPAAPHVPRRRCGEGGRRVPPRSSARPPRPGDTGSALRERAPRERALGARPRRRRARGGCGPARVTGKGKKERIVPLGGKAIDALRAWLAVRSEVIHPKLGTQDPRALFLSPRGARLGIRGVRKLVLKYGILGADGVTSIRTRCRHTVRHAHAERRGGPPCNPGDARARVALDDAAVHACVDRPPDESVRSGASARAARPGGDRPAAVRPGGVVNTRQSAKKLGCGRMPCAGSSSLSRGARRRGPGRLRGSRRRRGWHREPRSGVRGAHLPIWGSSSRSLSSSLWWWRSLLSSSNPSG